MGLFFSRGLRWSEGGRVGGEAVEAEMWTGVERLLCSSCLVCEGPNVGLGNPSLCTLVAPAIAPAAAPAAAAAATAFATATATSEVFLSC